jgi:hypothetical protein
MLKPVAMTKLTWSVRRFLYLGFLLLFTSCCLTISEEHLGNNLYLSEFDNVDRLILYSEESCTGSGAVIVPMTVMEYAYNSEWIIAKSANKRENTNIQYWIIKNHYPSVPSLSTIRSNINGPLDLESFNAELKNKDIRLRLREI